MNCDLITTDNIHFECKRCGKRIDLRRPAPDGLTVVCNTPDPPSFPPISEQLKNLGEAAVNFIKDGLRIAATDQIEDRKTLCEACEHRIGDRCGKCGCYLPIKTVGRVWRCPAGKW